MSLTDRIKAQQDRRQTDLTPVHERRQPTEPRWLRWTRENQSRGKSLDSGRAA